MSKKNLVRLLNGRGERTERQAVHLLQDVTDALVQTLVPTSRQLERLERDVIGPTGYIGKVPAPMWTVAQALKEVSPSTIWKGAPGDAAVVEAVARAGMQNFFGLTEWIGTALKTLNGKSGSSESIGLLKAALRVVHGHSGPYYVYGHLFRRWRETDGDPPGSFQMMPREFNSWIQEQAAQRLNAHHSERYLEQIGLPGFPHEVHIESPAEWVPPGTAQAAGRPWPAAR